MAWLRRYFRCWKLMAASDMLSSFIDIDFGRSTIAHGREKRCETNKGVYRTAWHCVFLILSEVIFVQQKYERAR